MALITVKSNYSLRIKVEEDSEMQIDRNMMENGEKSWEQLTRFRNDANFADTKHRCRY